MNWKLYVENPEEVDEQGIYVNPYDIRLVAGEFDGINDPAKTGIVIRNLASAQKWASEVFMLKGDVREVEFI